jgi:hypothetical protein
VPQRHQRLLPYHEEEDPHRHEQHRDEEEEPVLKTDLHRLQATRSGARWLVWGPCDHLPHDTHSAKQPVQHHDGCPGWCQRRAIVCCRREEQRWVQTR